MNYKLFLVFTILFVSNKTVFAKSVPPCLVCPAYISVSWPPYPNPKTNQLAASVPPCLAILSFL